MSTDRAEITVETAIARHVAHSFPADSRIGKPDATVAQIRSRITDRFETSGLHSEQDNQPPALVALYRRIALAFATAVPASDVPERSSNLAGIKGTLQNLRGAPRILNQRSVLEHAKIQLLIERHQLVLKNEFTEGFGRIEAWILSIAALGVVLLNAASILWALPILALSIGRSWYLDRQCKRRLEKISDIDALIERIGHIA